MVLVSPSLFWIPSGEMIAHGLFYPWPNAASLMDIAAKHFFSWVGSNGFGNPNTGNADFFFYVYAAVATFVGRSGHAGQVIILYLGFVGCIGGMYMLARSLGFTKISSLIAGAFYVISPMVMSGMPLEIVNLRVLPFYIGAPILLSMVVRVLGSSSSKRHLAAFGVLSVVLGSVGYSSLQYFILYLLLVLIYSMFAFSTAWSNYESRIRIIRRTFALLLITLLANLYWLSYFLSDLRGAYVSRAEPMFSDASLVRGFSVKLIDGFRMLPYPGQASISPWLSHYYTMWYTFIIFGFAVIAVFAFLNPKTKRAAIFPGLVLGVSLFLVKGIRPPLKQVGEGIFLYFPYITRLFRNPMYFEMLVVLALALLVGLSCGELIRMAGSKSSKLSTVTMVTVVILLGIYGWQFLIGGPMRSQPKDAVSQTIKVPVYYTELSRFLKQRNSNYRVLSIPTFTRQDVFVSYRWQKLYVGIPPLNVWSGKPVLRSVYPGYNGVDPVFDAVLRPDSGSVSQDATRLILTIANVRYITLHNDTDWGYINKTDPNKKGQDSHSFISTSNFLKQIKTFGKIDLYEVDSKYFLPRVYSMTDLDIVNGDRDDLSTLFSLDRFSLTKCFLFESNFKDTKGDVLSKKTQDVFIMNSSSSMVSDNSEYVGNQYIVSEKGQYELFMNTKVSLDENKESIVTLYINNNKISDRVPKIKSEGWILLGNVRLDKGTSRIRVYSVNNKGEPIPIYGTGVLLLDRPEPVKPAPKISYKRINDTKFIVHVSKFKNPYLLVFLESFHPGWKAYVRETNSSNSPIWETWFKKPVSEDKHLQANLYANAWWIDNVDKVKQTGEGYEIVLEYMPQRACYVGWLISVITFLGCAGYLIWDGYQRIRAIYQQTIGQKRKSSKTRNQMDV